MLIKKSKKNVKIVKKLIREEKIRPYTQMMRRTEHFVSMDFVEDKSANPKLPTNRS
jgi:hypothetical protein